MSRIFCFTLEVLSGFIHPMNKDLTKYRLKTVNVEADVVGISQMFFC